LSIKNGVWPVSCLLFCSGLAAMAIQVAWIREFRLVFGPSTAAMAAVVAIFMGGIGVGNVRLGRRADAVESPLLMYAGLELGVGISAALSPLLIDLARAGYIMLGGQSALGLFWATMVRLTVAAGVMAIPTILMGGTLPAAVRAVTTQGDERRKNAGWIYGFNALGAVGGALVSTFLLLPTVGTRTTLWLACLLSFVVAVASRALVAGGIGARRQAVVEVAVNRKENRRAKTGSRVSPLLVYVAAAVVGFAFFLMELVWYRMLGPILGGTTYTFGLILATALLGIGIGGASYPFIFRVARPNLRAFAFTCGLESALIALPFALGDRLALLAARYHEASGSFAESVWGWAVVAAIVVLPAAAVSGVQFPLIIAILGRGDDNVGRQVGMAFAWNTVGAILGSLAGGFGALPLLTAPGAWRLVVMLLALLGIVATAFSMRQEGAKVALLAPTVAVTLALACILAPGPTAVWRHSGIGAGRFALPERSPAELHNWMAAQRRRIVWEAEGVEASIAVVADTGLSFFINGKCDGHAVGDAGTQLVSGVLAAFLHPKPKSAFIVGLGTGETPGWLAEVASIERVDVVELEPSINKMARLCKVVNHNVLEHPKVHCIYNDAREVLLTTSTTYDLIFSEPSNPWRAGIANLFTQEFYRSAQSRLNNGGLFVQWLQGYEIDEQTVATVLATLQSVFGHVEIWQSKPEDMLLVCSKEPLRLSAKTLRGRMDEEPFRSAFACGWRVMDLEGVLSRYVGGPQLVAGVARQYQECTNTDDLNLIEYGFARTVGNQATGFSIRAMREAAVRCGTHRALVSEGEVNWRRVEDYRQMMYALFDGSVDPPPDPSAEQAARTEVLRRYWDADSSGMIRAWEAAAYEPLPPDEVTLLALACAHQGDSRARPLLRKIYDFNPVEARAIESILLSRQAAYGEAATQLENVLLGLRASPWCQPHVLELLFPTILRVAANKPDETRRLYSLLRQPFAVYLCEEDRLATAHALAGLLGPAAILETLLAYEPHVPWNERFLETRYRVYRQTNHPLVSRARRDLDGVRGR